MRGLFGIVVGVTFGAGCAPGPCNGSASLCDVALDQVVFPGTHNAMASVEDGFRLSNQTYPPRRQLDDGIRALLLDSYDVDGADVLCHAYCEFGQVQLADVLGDLRDFLDEHPRDLVVLVFQDALSVDRTIAAFDAAKLGDRLVTPPAAGALWPTLGELVGAGKQILLTRESGGPGPDTYAPFYDLGWDTPYTFEKPEDFNCDLLRGSRDHDLFLINHWIGNPLSSAENAAVANTAEQLHARLAACKQDADRGPTLLAVDFYEEGDLLSVVAELNTR